MNPLPAPTPTVSHLASVVLRRAAVLFKGTAPTSISIRIQLDR
ncbi:hypothetical protein [Piscinibacter sp. HJYY11]|nr:hypothetical protein [Piscinibacter sp. HJYY11]